MATLWNNYRYLFFRRFTQIGLLVLYFGANAAYGSLKGITLKTSF